MMASFPSLGLAMHPITWVHMVLHAFYSEVTPCGDMLEQGVSLLRPLVG